MNSMAQHTSHASINDPEVLPTPETVVLDANIFPSTWLTDLSFPLRNIPAFSKSSIPTRFSKSPVAQ